MVSCFRLFFFLCSILFEAYLHRVFFLPKRTFKVIPPDDYNCSLNCYFLSLQPRVSSHAQRRVLPATGAVVRAGLARVVFHAAALPRRARENAASRQDGQRNQHRATYQLRYRCTSIILRSRSSLPLL